MNQKFENRAEFLSHKGHETVKDGTTLESFNLKIYAKGILTFIADCQCLDILTASRS